MSSSTHPEIPDYVLHKKVISYTECPCCSFTYNFCNHLYTLPCYTECQTQQNNWTIPGWSVPHLLKFWSVQLVNTLLSQEATGSKMTNIINCIHNSSIGEIFQCFFSHQVCIFLNQNYSKNSNIVKY